MTKDKAKIDLWLKDVAPSDGLRKWFNHDPKKWNDFKKKYGLELSKKPELILKLKQAEKERGTVTLLYSLRKRQPGTEVQSSDSIVSLRG